ncbi:hypothetical protein A2U01_0117891, partial [Trifolium medium]|nr:hypothetical protein [Trifolium medium]
YLLQVEYEIPDVLHELLVGEAIKAV